MAEQQTYKRHMITSALPYANGPIHIGHLAGAYLPADIYVRYLRMKGEDVVYVCGSDEHGVPITLRAKKEGKSPQEVVDHYHAMNKRSFEDFGIAFDYYHRTSAQLHHETASAFFRTLYDKGEFVEEASEQYYDEEQQQFLADRYITGTCPNCSFEKAYGDQCENCGKALSPRELINPTSAISGNKPVLKKTKHWYLPLDKYQREWLEQWILSKEKEWKPNVFGQCKSWLDLGLQKRAVTRDLEWGVKVPIDDAEGKVLYVWFDAPIGYISSTKQWALEHGKDWEPYWKDPGTKLVHFIGKDNIVFHCIVFPAMLKAEGSFILPDNVPSNEFLNLEGDKLSTSRNHAVWLDEYMTDFPGKQDVLRYVLCANMPENKDNDFTWKDFQARNNNELVATFGNFVNRVLTLFQKYYDGLYPLDTLAVDPELNVEEHIRKFGSFLEQYQFRFALAEVMNIARKGNEYLASKEPWKLIKSDPEAVQQILCRCLELVYILGVTSKPFLPATANKIASLLGLDPAELKFDLDVKRGAEKIITIHHHFPKGHRLQKPSLLFEKIEDDPIQAQIDKLRNKAEPAGDPIKPTINFEDFVKMDIRTGTILTASKVEKADKLLQFTVDIGTEKRTILSGIAEYFKPEELIGKQVSVLANLAPRKIRGIESQGMILLAEDAGGKLVFAVPEEKVNNGAMIS